MGVKRELNWGGPENLPLAQAWRWVPNALYGWQCRVLADCAVQGNFVSVVTPNNAGKTSTIIPVVGLSWLAAFPGGKVVSTAGVERQIRDALWPVLSNCLSRFKKWSILDELLIRAPTVRGLPAATWKGISPKDPKAAEGFHAQVFNDEHGVETYAPLLVIIDEAKAIDEEMVWTFMRRCEPDVLLMISTPGDDTGPFFNAFHRDRGRPWLCHEVTWGDCLHLREGFALESREREIELLGREHPRVKSWIFGEFSRTGGHRIFENFSDVERAMAGTVAWVRGDRRFAIDFSLGGDEQVFGAREGNRVMDMETFHIRDSVDLAKVLADRFKRWRATPGDVVADNGGAGAVVIDILESMGWKGIERYMFGNPARDRRLFTSRGMEDHWNVRTRLERQALVLPNDPVLKEQMRSRSFVIRNDDNTMHLEPKEKIRDRGDPSPDRLDTLVMLCSDMGPVQWGGGIVKIPGVRAAMNRCGTYEECLRKMAEDDTTGTSRWATGGML